MAKSRHPEAPCFAPKDLRTTRQLHRSFGGQKRPLQDDNTKLSLPQPLEHPL